MPNVELLDIGSLIYNIGVEIQRIFPLDDFEGSQAQYEWLLKHYGVTEDDDYRYTLTCDYYVEDPDELDDEQLEAIEDQIDFLDEPEVVNAFLGDLLRKYRSNTIVYSAAATE